MLCWVVKPNICFSKLYGLICAPFLANANSLMWVNLNVQPFDALSKSKGKRGVEMRASTSRLLSKHWCWQMSAENLFLLESNQNPVCVSKTFRTRLELIALELTPSEGELNETLHSECQIDKSRVSQIPLHQFKQSCAAFHQISTLMEETHDKDSKFWCDEHMSNEESIISLLI